MTRQIEHLRPHQIAEAMAERALVYLPLGTIEWHCHHLPVGLDALTAHGLCLRAAARTGGLVWPVLYYGTGGDHGAFPWTVMMPSKTEIAAQLTFTLSRLADLKVAEVVLFSGHFADEQIAMILQLADDWNAKGAGPRVTALAVNGAPIPNLAPDHAGLFETTLLDGIAPGLADLGRLDQRADDIDRFDPSSPLWGIVGADPRQAGAWQPDNLVNAVVDWMVDQVGGARS